MIPTNRSPHPPSLHVKQPQTPKRTAPASREKAGCVYAKDVLSMPRLHWMPDFIPLLGYHARQTAVHRPSPPRMPTISWRTQRSRETRYIFNHKPQVRLPHQGDGREGKKGSFYIGHKVRPWLSDALKTDSKLLGWRSSALTSMESMHGVRPKRACRQVDTRVDR